MFDPATMRTELRRLHADVRSLCAQLDPNVVGLTDIDEVFDLVVATRKLLDGATTRLAARYEQAGRWRDRGARSAADDIARRTGVSPTTSKKQLDTARRLDELPAVDNALRSGKLSGEQAATITSAAPTPEAAEELVDAARTASHRELRRLAAEARARDGDAEQRRQRIHRNRRVSRWIDDDGAYNLHLVTTPEHGAEIDARLQPVIDAVFDAARRNGNRERLEASAADALHRCIAADDSPAATRRPSGQAVRPDRKVICTVDLAALRRGSLADDETCTIAGVGPVSVAAARALLGDAALALVIKDGVDIRNVTHLGRRVTAAQRTALEARGYRCEIIGCGSTSHLEIDHIPGWSLTGTTRLDDLAWLCPHDHARKTRQGLELRGPPGRRTLVHPGASSEADRPDTAAVQNELFA